MIPHLLRAALPPRPRGAAVRLAALLAVLPLGAAVRLAALLAVLPRGAAVRLAALLAVLPLGAGCGSETPQPNVALFDLAAIGTDADLFALPYPNDLRRTASGTLELARLARGQPELIQRYLDVVAQRRTNNGFALNGAAYFRFRAPLDTACLPPTPSRSLDPGATVYWVNIQPSSLDYGQRLPIRVRFSSEKGLYIGENNLAVLPVAGFPLEPNARYAVILTDGLCDLAGHGVAAAADFERLLAEATPDRAELQEPHKTYAPLRAYLRSRSITNVISAALFTTGDATALVGRARAVVRRRAAPTAADLVAAQDGGSFVELRGTYRAPNFQQGTPPYSLPPDGGGITVDAAGDPQPAREETLRFALAVPQGTMPAAGWPIVLYAHGTGGSYRTFLDEELPQDLAAVQDAAGKVIAGLAMISIDQNLHGPRDPTGAAPEYTFFNFQNPVASTFNVVQAGIDDFSLLRLVQELRVSSVPWAASAGRSGALTFDPPLRFDPRRVYFMGHSQGGITGPLFLAHEPEVKGAVLSGAGGKLVLSLLEKQQPIALAPLLQAALREPIDEFHPVLNLIQQLIEPADTINYGRMLIRRRAAGVTAKHVLMTEGFVDRQTPSGTGDALATAIGLPLTMPVLHPIDALGLRGLAARPLPLSGNLSSDGTAVTGGLLQYRAVAAGATCGTDSDCHDQRQYCDAGQCRIDGHYVLFRDPNARRHYSTFLATMARDGVPTIGP